ncbi:hypothetical protein A6A19_01370 [Actinobacillus delphinicola]|uniref:Imm49 family immunity protein n=1 Tax=Actinobacillus delphinicola TaxID=51161 RepID=UPI002442F99A|nr:Imm49 family immunity protein [Actinobacillus delphinicola]MDG6896678.1 hypothetical protein [Actinobacillus delphinicola]
MNLNYKGYIGSECKRNYEESVNFIIDSIENENKYIDKYIKLFEEGSCKHTTLLGISHRHLKFASLALLKDSDVKKFKQEIYLSAKLYIMCNYWDRIIPSYLGWKIFLSDSPELIEYVKSNISYFIKQYEKCTASGMPYGGFLLYHILLALNDDWEKLEKSVITLLESNRKNQIRYIPDHKFFLAMCKKDTQGMEEALNMLLAPKLARKRMYSLGVFFDFYLNVIVLTYAKIATLKGFDLNIDHPTAPKELIVYAPLKEYKDPYNFMQDYSFDTHFEWAEKRIQIEHEADMEAKKLKNRIKAKFKRLFRIGE